MTNNSDATFPRWETPSQSRVVVLILFYGFGFGGTRVGGTFSGFDAH